MQRFKDRYTSSIDGHANQAGGVDRTSSHTYWYRRPWWGIDWEELTPYQQRKCFLEDILKSRSDFDFFVWIPVNNLRLSPECNKRGLKRHFLRKKLHRLIKRSFYPCAWSVEEWGYAPIWADGELVSNPVFYALVSDDWYVHHEFHSRGIE
jgi:hypothetical protein